MNSGETRFLTCSVHGGALIGENNWPTPCLSPSGGEVMRCSKALLRPARRASALQNGQKNVSAGVMEILDSLMI